MSLGNQNLTDVSGQQAITSPGMAHWAGTGPRGKTCGNCAYLKTKTVAFVTGHCDKYRQMMRNEGPAIPARSLACKYFEPCKTTNQSITSR